MSKLDALKDKITQLKAQVAEKLDNIPILKKWREKAAPAAPSADTPTAAGRSGPSTGLISIYREGRIGTRLQVIFVCLLALTALVSTGVVAAKIVKRFRENKANTKLAVEYIGGFKEINEKMQAKASMVSIGTMTVHTYVSEGKNSFLSIDLWARTNDAGAGDFAQKNDIILHDRALAALNEMYNAKVSLLTPEGKDLARAKIKEAMNQVMKNGQVEEVFFYNLTIQ